jgi:hypothetical protein
MKAIAVTPKNQTEFKFITDLLKKLGVGTSTLTKEDRTSAEPKEHTFCCFSNPGAMTLLKFPS